MANPLEIGSVSPPPPNPDNGNVGQSQQPQQTGPSAPPTHAQTVAAMRHFDAIRGELSKLLSNPALGKSNLKDPIIGSVTNLVAERMLSPAEAVIELAKVPDDPIAQRKWAMQQYQQARMAENAVLDRYGQSQPHLGDVQSHMAMDSGSPDDHMNNMRALSAGWGSQ